MQSELWTMTRTLVRDAFQSMKRNTLMSLAAVASIIAALVILGVFLVLTINIRQLTSTVESELEVKIFLSKDITETQKYDIQSALEHNDLIKSVQFENRDEALQNFSGTLSSSSTLLSMFNTNNNPMPESFIIQAKDSDSMDQVKEFAKSFEGNGAEYVKYGEEYVTALLNFNSFVNTLSIVVLAVLSVISILLIYNTIKLTVFARRREIGIMKYVGATDAYIRIPFILEGTFLGIIAAVVAALIIRCSYYYILGIIASNVLMSLTSALASPNSVIFQLMIFFVVYGVVIGAAGSVFAIRKFLDV